MDRRATGFGFCVVAAALFAVHHSLAVLWLPHVSSWPTEIGRIGAAYQEVGHHLVVAAIVSLVVGGAYLLAAEGEAAAHLLRQRGSEDEKQTAVL